MKSLYQISTELQALNDALTDNGGDVTPEIETALAIAQADLNVKGANYGLVILSNDATITAIDAEIARLTKNKAAISNTNERLKKAVSDAMLHFGIEKIETGIVKLSFRASKALQVTHENAVPSQFWKTKTTSSIDKVAIKEAIERGEVVPGAFVESKKNLQVK